MEAGWGGVGAGRREIRKALPSIQPDIDPCHGRHRIRIGYIILVRYQPRSGVRRSAPHRTPAGAQVKTRTPTSYPWLMLAVSSCHGFCRVVGSGPVYHGPSRSWMDALARLPPWMKLDEVIQSELHLITLLFGQQVGGALLWMDW